MFCVLETHIHIAIPLISPASQSSGKAWSMALSSGCLDQKASRTAWGDLSYLFSSLSLRLPICKIWMILLYLQDYDDDYMEIMQKTLGKSRHSINADHSSLTSFWCILHSFPAFLEFSVSCICLPTEENVYPIHWSRCFSLSLLPTTPIASTLCWLL